MRIGNCGWLLLAVVLVAPAAIARGQEFAELVKCLPGRANSLVLLNVDKILSSPIAIQKNWKMKHDQAYAAGLSMLPPDATQAVFATELDLTEMQPEWESVVMRLDGAPDMPNLARMSRGSLEFIDNHNVVALPTNAYAVQFSDSVVGAMTPTNRQSVGRWLRDAETRTAPDLSAYLTEAFGYANGLGTPIIMAIDLQDIVTPAEVLALLKASDKFTGQPGAELQRLANVLAGIRGLTLGITLSDKAYGKVKVDFADNIGVTPELAKAMLLHALEKRGAMLKELPDWTPNVSGKQVTMEGYLTTSGMKRLMSLFDRAPAFRQAPPEAASTPGVSDDRAKFYAQKTYFDKVADYVNDLQSNASSAGTFGAIAIWYDTYARKIGQLPVAGIDPELVKYAQETSNLMYQASSQIRNANYQKSVRQSNVQPQYVTNTWGVTYGYSYGWDGYGGPVGASGSYTTRDYGAENDEKTNIRSQETSIAGMSSAQIMQRIAEETTSTRQRMSLKYKENF
jgi:hypothetical protein